MRKMDNYVRQAFKEKMKNIDFFRSLEFSRRERIRRYPLATLRLFFVDYVLKFLIYKLHLLSPLVSARTFWGDKMRVVFPDNRAVYHYGLLDGQEIAVNSFIVDKLKEGDTFLDAGAHTGYYTLLASKIVGPRGSVHAFEPTPRTFGILKSNVEAAGRSNIRLNKEALLDKNKDIEIVDFGIRYGGLNSALPLDRLPRGFIDLSSREHIRLEKIKAEAITVDDYCLRNNVEPNIIKVDIEGSEYSLLLGARETIKTHRPLLVVEIWQEEGRRDNFERIVELMKNYSYTPRQFGKEFNLLPYSKGDEILSSNFVFLPR
jgi:FkbM family methyltransferase